MPPKKRRGANQNQSTTVSTTPANISEDSSKTIEGNSNRNDKTKPTTKNKGKSIVNKLPIRKTRSQTAALLLNELNKNESSTSEDNQITEMIAEIPEEIDKVIIKDDNIEIQNESDLQIENKMDLTTDDNSNKQIEPNFEEENVKSEAQKMDIVETNDKNIETETCVISEQLETMNIATKEPELVETTENSLVEFENLDELAIECVSEEIIPAEILIDEDNSQNNLTEDLEIKIAATVIEKNIEQDKELDTTGTEKNQEKIEQEIEEKPKINEESLKDVIKLSVEQTTNNERQITKEEFMEIIQMKPACEEIVVQKSEMKNFEQEILKITELVVAKTEMKKVKKLKKQSKQIKQQKPKTVLQIKKEINKKSKKKESVKETNKSDEENSVRRSSRIKSISVLKQRSKGHGLVKLKKDAIKMVESEHSGDSNSNNSEKSIQSSHESLNSCTSLDFDNNKPVKVKSRWRRTSELEMNVLNPAITASTTPPTTANAIPAISDSGLNHKNETTLIHTITEKVKQPNEDEEVALRLKQFIHLKENLYLTDRAICKEAKKMICDCFLTQEEIGRGEYGCGEDCLNRLLMIECGQLCPIGERCTNKKFQKQQFAPVEVFKTEKKGLGLRASANIPYGEFILEYVGEVLNYDEFDKRADNYSSDKNTHYYFMSLRADGIIDATRKGNISRFINHSCDPNAETQKWTVNGELRIGFFSKRTIWAGEEITFDYRFERYGKEAQKCYCEASTCRGWLGEEPDDDEDEDEDEEEEEEEEEIKIKHEKEESIEKTEESTEIKTIENEEEKSEKDQIKPEIKEKPEKKNRKYSSRRKPRIKDIFEDLDQLDEEIEMLITTGLKNQAHTLKLSRLIVRSKEPAQRTKLLRILRRGELPCRRLFLDYHGLKLMHGYMTDAEDLSKTNKKFESLRLELLQTLATLPIPNKTMLEDSKVLPTVRKWSTNSTSSSPLDSNSSSPKIDLESSKTIEENKSLESTETIIIKEENVEIKEEIKSEEKIIVGNDEKIDDSTEIRKSVGMNFNEKTMNTTDFKNISGEKLAEEISNIFNEDTNESSSINETNVENKDSSITTTDDQPNYEEEIIALALKLLEEWSNLKEVFKIPKKERIEQMKEHEREANRNNLSLIGFEQDVEKRNDNRYRVLKRDRFLNDNNNRKSLKSDDRIQLPYSSTLGKLERRKLFAMRMEHKEEERRRKQREIWLKQEQHCILLGTDPRLTAPFDPNRGYQCIWNPQIGQWQNYPINPQAVAPPSQNPNVLYNPQTNPSAGNYTSYPPPHLQAQPPPVQLQQIGMSPNLHTLPSLPYQEELKNVEDFSQVKFMGPIPPPAKLPPKWKCAKDKYGRPYYYHIKIRKSQWEPPELPPPIQEESSDTSSSSESSSTSSDTSSDDWDSEDDIDDTKLLLDVRKQMEKQIKFTFTKTAVPIPTTVKDVKNDEIVANISTSVKEEEKIQTEEMTVDSEKEEISNKETIETNEQTIKDGVDGDKIKEKSGDEEEEDEEQISVDEHKKNDEPKKSNEQQTKVDEQKRLDEPPTKKKRAGLVHEIIISPRTEEDRLQFREDLKRYKQNKEMLKRQKELILHQTKKHMKEKRHKATVRTKMKQMLDSNSESAKKIKETFRSNMASVVVSVLNAYRKLDCKEGRITNTEDFKHLARKLTHFVMLKEMKHVLKIEDLVCTENVKSKAKEYIRKYMSKFGETYQKRNDEPDF